MSISEDRRSYIFTRLDTLAVTDKHNLLKEFENCDVSVLHDLAIVLSDKPNNFNYKTPETFADCIYEMKNIKRKWSREIGNLFITIDNQISQGNTNSAMHLLNEFITSCTVPYYREIAVCEKARLDKELVNK